MSRSRWTVGLFLLLFLLQGATIGLAQARRHSGRKKTKPVPQRPENELSLGEVTIYGKSASVRLPRNKVVPSEIPQNPPLLTWREFRLVPPSELKAPELPARPSSEVNRIALLDLRGGSARSGDGELLFWKNARRWQVGLNGGWANTLGTHPNRFRHYGTGRIWGEYRLSRNWQTDLQIEFLQQSFGFGRAFSSPFFQSPIPQWRKVQALRYEWGLRKNNQNGDFWRVRYSGHLFPLDENIDSYAPTKAKTTTVRVQEKWQALDFEGQLSRGVLLSLRARLISNQDRFSYLPESASFLWPPHIPLNSQTFIRIAPSISKRLTPQFFGEIGLQGFYFSASGQHSAVLTAKPVARFLYSPGANWEIFASYFAGYRYRSLFDAYGENPFCEQNLDLNTLEFQKTRAQLGINWRVTPSLTVGNAFSENLVENYPAWSTYDWLYQIETSPPQPGILLTPGLFHTTYLPRVHYNAWHGSVEVGQPDRGFLRLTVVARFNKSSSIDSTTHEQWNVPHDIPELPNLEIGFRGALPFASSWKIEWRGAYRGARLVERQSLVGQIVEPYLSEFFLLNLQLDYRFPFGNVFLGTWNVLDQDIEEFDQIWADGRKFFAGIQVKF